MNLRFLETFVWVARLRNFSLAAEKLCTTQAAVSNRIATLERELEVSRRYLEIEALRLGDRLQTRWEVASLPGGALLPALTVQPLLENAVSHGIEPSPTGGLVSITGRVVEGVLEVRVPVPEQQRKTREIPIKT